MRVHPAIFLTNTLSRGKEPFVPVVPGRATIYSCGPTVYGRAHIGNFRAFLTSDILARVLGAFGYRVKRVENITDIGHLTDDGDAGEDKIEQAARQKRTTAQEIARTYTDAYLEDSARLHIAHPFARPKASEHIAAQIEFVRELESRNFTYHTSDGVYFDTGLLPDYGPFSAGGQDERSRIGKNPGKKNQADFALWKFSARGTKRHMEWPSPWGTGFPGWHIECSAMSRAYLGFPFDIHTGGVDHIPVHHTNEIAQNEAATGSPGARIWVHNEFVTVGGEKMSKSLGNIVTVPDIARRGHDPLAYRYLVLMTHYRQLMNFTWEGLAAAENALAGLAEEYRKLDFLLREQTPLRRTLLSLVIRSVPGKAPFLAALGDDLNTPKALSVVWDTIRDLKIPTHRRFALLSYANKILDIFPDAVPPIPAEIRKTARRRQGARERRDFAEADALREKLNKKGYGVDDTPHGPVLYALYRPPAADATDSRRFPHDTHRTG